MVLVMCIIVKENKHRRFNAQRIISFTRLSNYETEPVFWLLRFFNAVRPATCVHVLLK